MATKVQPKFIADLSAIYVTQIEVGTPSGVASLDVSGKVPLSQLPSVVMEYQGAWNPTTNTPTIVDGTGTNGSVYYVSALNTGTVVGLTDPSMTNFQIGDLIIYSSSINKWQLVTPAAGVKSVNGAQGAVTVNAINQLTGDITTTVASGSQSKAASISATSNSTLTTLSSLTTASSLSSIGTITTGTWHGTATSGQSFITSGTIYTTPAGITTHTNFKFQIIGGGGGGAGSSAATSHGGGGGSGAVGILYINGLSPSTNYTIAIGTAGAAGDGSPTDGIAGGDTTLTIGATTYTAHGGGGGLIGNSTYVGGVGGTATNCTINISGQNGMGTGTTSAAVVAPNGGSTPMGWGMGGVGHAVFFILAGYFGTGYGSGGAGGFTAGCAGGSGTQGAILVEWQN